MGLSHMSSPVIANIPFFAEGEETKEQETLLKKLKCDFAQGYLYSKPIPAKEFEQLVITAN